MNISTAPILRLPQNTKGRDYVVGDVHGTKSLLLLALEKAGFDPEVDRLLLAGDLVDRGPESAEMLDFLRRPSVYSTRGNHEAMALQCFDVEGNFLADKINLRAFYKNGLGWWLDLTPKERVPLLEQIKALPFVIEVPTTRGLVGILHAEVPPRMNWSDFTNAIERLDPVVCHSCLWGRDRTDAQDTSGVPGVGRVFVGHTVQWGGLSKLGNVYVIDTGAFAFDKRERGALTMAQLTAGTIMLAAPRQVSLMDIVIDENPPALPFGQGPGYITVKG